MTVQCKGITYDPVYKKYAVLVMHYDKTKNQPARYEIFLMTRNGFDQHNSGYGYAIIVSSMDSDEVISGHFHLFKESFYFSGITEAYKNKYNSKYFNTGKKKYPANKMTTFKYNPYERNNCLESVFVES